MSLTLKEYVEKTRKDITLPSGLPVTIRKLPPRLLFKLFSALPVGKTAKEIADTPVLREQFPRLVEEMLPACFVKPKVTLEPTEKDGELYIDDMYPDDVFFAIEAIFRHSGITAERLKERESFRRE